MEISILTTKEAQDAIGNILEEKAKIQGFAIEPVETSKHALCLKAYIKKDTFTKSFIENLQKRIQHLASFGINIGSGMVDYRDIGNKDWMSAWKQYYQPIKISERMIIKPHWEDLPKVKEDTMVIELDPRAAFGTGTHPTTILSLRLLEKYVNKQDDIIDVGCGSGILSIAACLLGAKQVLAVDHDRLAIKNTKHNAKINNVQDRITLHEGDLLQQVKGVNADLIVANILSEVIVKMLPQVWNALRKEGLFIASGIITRKQLFVERALEEAGFSIIDVQSKKNWVALVAKK